MVAFCGAKGDFVLESFLSRGGVYAGKDGGTGRARATPTGASRCARHATLLGARISGGWKPAVRDSFWIVFAGVGKAGWPTRNQHSTGAGHRWPKNNTIFRTSPILDRALQAIGLPIYLLALPQDGGRTGYRPHGDPDAGTHQRNRHPLCRVLRETRASRVGFQSPPSNIRGTDSSGL